MYNFFNVFCFSLAHGLAAVIFAHKMAAWKVCALLSLLVVLCREVATAQESCHFSLPVSGSPGQCASFDLSPLAQMGPFNVSANGTINSTYYDTYLLKLCGNISFDDVPIVCYEQKRAPAYLFNTASNCYVIGALADTVVVSGIVLSLL